MTNDGQNHSIHRGEDLQVRVTLTDVTLPEGATLEARYRNKNRNERVLVIADASITREALGPPAVVIVHVASAATSELDSDSPHDWALWRTDDGSRTPYLIGSVKVISTA